MDVEVLEMDFFFHVMYFISQDSLMASAERKRGEENWSSFTLETREGTEEEAQCHESFTGRSTLWQINPPQTGGRGGDRRESRGASPQRGLSVVSRFVASSTVHLLALLPLSLPGLIGRSVGMWLALVTPGRADGFAFSETRETRQEEEI